MKALLLTAVLVLLVAGIRGRPQNDLEGGAARSAQPAAPARLARFLELKESVGGRAQARSEEAGGDEDASEDHVGEKGIVFPKGYFSKSSGADAAAGDTGGDNTDTPYYWWSEWSPFTGTEKEE